MGGIGLTDLDDAFERAPGNDGEAPDGNYVVRVDHVGIRETRKGNRIMEWRLVVLDSEYEGAELRKISVLRNDQTLTYLKRDLLTCGIQLERLSELPERLHELLGLKLEVAVKTRNGFKNVYLNRCLRPDEDALTEDDLPF